MPVAAEPEEAERPRLLVFELRMLGDAVLSLPFVRGALTRHDVYVCCRPPAVPFFTSLLPPGQVVTWEPPWIVETGKYGLTRWCKAGWPRLVGQLHRIGAETAVCAWADARTQLLMALSRAPVRVGFPMNERNYLAHDRPWRRRQLRVGRLLERLACIGLARPLLTQRVDRDDYRQTHLTDWRQLAQVLDIPWDTTPPWLQLPAPEPLDRYEPLRTLAATARSRARDVWLMHPGARLPTKRWPAERFQALIDEVFTPREMPLVIIDPPDGPALRPGRASHLLLGTPTLADLVYVLNHADAVVCNDSLVAHLAAALGKRVIAVFGSGNPEWFAPYANEDLIVRADACPHHPCMDRCQMPTCVCLDTLNTEKLHQVVDTIHAQC